MIPANAATYVFVYTTFNWCIDSVILAPWFARFALSLTVITLACLHIGPVHALL